MIEKWGVSEMQRGVAGVEGISGDVSGRTQEECSSSRFWSEARVFHQARTASPRLHSHWEEDFDG
jgi:hypothetical protein